MKESVMEQIIGLKNPTEENIHDSTKVICGILVHVFHYDMTYKVERFAPLNYKVQKKHGLLKSEEILASIEIFKQRIDRTKKTTTFKRPDKLCYNICKGLMAIYTENNLLVVHINELPINYCDQLHKLGYVRQNQMVVPFSKHEGYKNSLTCTEYMSRGYLD